MTIACPTITKKQLAQQCRAIGLTAGDTIMVHASLRSVGEILGGPDVLIDALLETVGPAGTMMAYVGCQSPFDDVGRGRFTPEQEAFILEHCPAFDPGKARASRDFGAFAGQPAEFSSAKILDVAWPLLVRELNGCLKITRLTTVWVSVHHWKSYTN